MDDLIKRADALEQMAQAECGLHYGDCEADNCSCSYIKRILDIPSADAVSADTQTEEQARFVAKETELAHIEARLENAEKRLQGVCVANFVAEQLERLKDMTDEERWDFFIRFFSPSADAVDCTDFIEWLVDRVLDETIWEYNSVAYGEIICRKLEKLGILEVTEEPSYYIRPSADAVQGEWVRHELWGNPWFTCSECNYHGRNDFNFCPNCGARMKGGAE